MPPLDDRQRGIFEWLQEKRPVLATAYQSALSLLATEPENGHERTRISLICHSMREVMNRLPTATLLGQGALDRGTVERHTRSSSQVEGLPRLLVDYPNLDLLQDAENVPVPHYVAVIFDRLIKTADFEERRRVGDIAAFLTDDGNAKHPAVHEWRRLSRNFAKWAHLSDKQERVEDPPSTHELGEWIRAFEDHVDAVRSAFFDSKSAIDDLLADANRMTDEVDYAVPTEDEVQAAVRRLTSYQLRRVFYEGLKNPHWVKPLADIGVFGNPPEPEPTGDGYIRDVFWPEIAYLTNVAPQAPEEVVDVLLRLKASSNPWVRRAAFVIGSQVPAKEAARLKPLISAWDKAGGLGWRTDPRDLVSFATNLLTGGQAKYGVKFVNLLFRPKESNDGAHDPIVELDSYWYSEELPRVVEALGDRALEVILPWLEVHEKQKKSAGADFDWSGLGRSTIAERGDNPHEVGDALIDAVRDAALPGFLKDPNATLVLLKRPSLLVTHRIALFTLTQAIEGVSREGGDVSKLAAIARELIVDPKSRDEYARIEFVALAQALAETDASGLDILVEFIGEGHFTDNDLERIRQNLKARGKSDEEITLDIERSNTNWRHRVLTGIGRELLPEVLREQLDSLNTGQGVLTEPLAPPFQMTSWTGPDSPVTQAEMTAMSPAELMAQLESWHDTGNGLGPEPSHEGQARVVAAVMTTDPMALHGESDLTARLRPTYIRTVLNGWRAAYRAELDLDWDLVTETLSDVIRHEYESSLPIEGGPHDDDPDFAEAKHAAVGLLQELAKRRNKQRIPVDQMTNVAELLIESASDEVAWINYSEYEPKSDSGMDPFTTSLNWQWPNMVRGLIDLISHGGETSWSADALSSLEQQLQRDDDRGALSAVLGEGLDKLLKNAHGLLMEHLDSYFGTQAGVNRGQQIALTTAIAMHYYRPELYKLLTGPMIAVLESDEEITVGWGDRRTPKERIGQWVIEAIIWGHINSDDPLRQALYQISDPGVRGEAIGHIAWSFLHAETIDDSIRDRLAELWDERVRHVEEHPDDKAELNEFYWFVRCGAYPSDWWLPRLKKAVELNSELETRGMIGEQLAEAAQGSPRGALDTLALLLSREDAPERDDWDLRRHALAPVIAAAIDSPDTRLAQDSRDLMNKMGARGEIDLQDRVQASQNGSGTA